MSKSWVDEAVMDTPFAPDREEISNFQEELVTHGLTIDLLDKWDHLVAFYMPGIMGRIELVNGGHILFWNQSSSARYTPPERSDNPFHSKPRR